MRTLWPTANMRTGVAAAGAASASVTSRKSPGRGMAGESIAAACASERLNPRMSWLMQRVVGAVEDAEHREAILLVDVVEDVVVVDGEVVAAADALQQRGPRWVRVVGERDDGLPDVAQRALRDRSQLAVGAVGDVEARR